MKGKAEYLIKFNEVDSCGNIFKPGSINKDSLNHLKVSGAIEDFEIDENGVKVIKAFKLGSVSM